MEMWQNNNNARCPNVHNTLHTGKSGHVYVVNGHVRNPTDFFGVSSLAGEDILVCGLTGTKRMAPCFVKIRLGGNHRNHDFGKMDSIFDDMKRVRRIQSMLS